MAYTSRVCPRCWTPYRPRANRCQRCGFDLQKDESASFIDLFGPPEVLRRRYQIQDNLAKSKVGHIYKALDLETRTPCVIKELSGAALLDPLEAELVAIRLERRIRQLSQLAHPNMVRIHRLLSEGSRHFVIMDFIEGPSLEKVLQERERAIPEPVVLLWGSQLCAALGYLHEQDPPLCFPDLAPRHVILRSESQPILVDLGLTHLFERHRERTESVAEDIAALGSLLYRMLTPTPGPGAASDSTTRRRRPPIQQLNPEVSMSTAQAIGRAMNRRPEDRFTSMAQFREILLAQVSSPDLIATEEDPIHVIPLIEPYELIPGHHARTLQELVVAIIGGGREEWDVAVAQFLEGTLTAWLHEVENRLQEAGRESAAQKISAVAIKGDAMRREAKRGTATQGQAIFSQWLAHTGYTWGQPKLAVGTTFLRLGAIKGELRLGAIFDIKNEGAGFLSGEVKSRVEWLRVREGEFGCRAGESVPVTVELRDRSMLSRPLSAAQALHITSSGGETWVGASVSAPRPMLTLDQELSTLRSTIDFGEVHPGQTARSKVFVRNEGGGILTGQISNTVPWLRAKPTRFQCRAGSTAPIDVELRPNQLPRGATVQSHALIVDSDYGQGWVEVKANRVQPLLKLLSDSLDFGTVAPVFRISQTLRVTNSGTGLLEGRVTSQVNWLTVEQADFQCRPSEPVLITVWANPVSLPGGQTEISDALVLDSNGGYQTSPVRLVVRRPRLQVDHRPLDFGVLLPGQEGVMPLRVSNTGVTPLHVELVPHMPWLTIEPNQITCATGQETEVRLTLHVPTSAESDTLRMDRALYVASDGGVANLDLLAEIVAPQLAVDPLHLDFGLIGPSEIARGRLLIRNEGSGTLEWRLEGEFTWLEVSPRQGECTSGETTAIEINGFALALPEGTISAQAVLHLESNGGHLDIPISVAIAEPILTVLPLLLDLGISENYAPLEGVFRIANRGGGHLSGEITSEVPWLRAFPSSFDCATGSVVEIGVFADPQSLAEGEILVPSALVVDSSSGLETVDVRLEIVPRPILEVIPQALVLSVSEIEEGDIVEEHPSPTQVLSMANQGYGALRVRYQPTVEWLTTDRGSSTLRHGRRAQVIVSLNVATWRAGGKSQEAYVDIRSGEDTLVSIPVTILEEDHPSGQVRSAT